MRLILVRHGQTPSNVIGSLDTVVPGPGLTDLGLAQAAAVPARLGAEPIEAIFASTHVRTQYTAEPLAAARGLDVQVRAGLRELAAGDLEGRTDPDAVGQFFEVMTSWIQGDLDAPMPGGESGREVIDRFDEVAHEIADSGVGTAVAFSHGGAIRLWAAARARNLGSAFPLAGHLGNTGVVILSGDASGWDCEFWDPAPG
ncbi:histidine phosphatase family protein [Nakamurella silvestris]|nr:histidine phosphatase family protein [Nakamurella silvestris]